MSWLDNFRSRMQPVQSEEGPAEKQNTAGALTLQDVLSRYELVSSVHEAGNSAVIVADRAPSGDGPIVSLKEGDTTAASGVGEKVDYKEIGQASKTPYFAEYNTDLQGARLFETIDRMRRSDATTRGSLRLVKVPVLSARWFVEAASEEPDDQLKARFVWWNLTERLNWIYTITNMLLMLDFGYIPLEKVFVRERVLLPGMPTAPRIIWGDLAPRHPGTVTDWEYDKHGRPKWAEFSGDPNEYKIKRHQMLLFTFDNEVGNITGTPVLRSAYPHWYYKTELYKIDAIQKERHGIGVPVIKLPPNFTPEDKEIAEAIGRNLRTNERAHITLPPLWEILFAKIEGQPVDVLASIDHHDKMIEKNVLASFMSAASGSSSRGGSTDSQQNMFLKATRFVADIISAELNINGIPQLVAYNWPKNPNGFPKLKARRIGEQADWRAMSFAIRNLVGAKVITPDERLEKAMREEMDLPPADPDTRREVATPQAGGGGNAGGNGTKQRGQKAGLPRQAPPNSNPPGNNRVDRSGG